MITNSWLFYRKSINKIHININYLHKSVKNLKNVNNLEFSIIIGLKFNQ
jgi:hypothetical protein